MGEAYFIGEREVGMFGMKGIKLRLCNLEHASKCTNSELERLIEKHRDLMRRHKLLLEHFGLDEETTPATTELRTKKGSGET